MPLADRSPNPRTTIERNALRNAREVKAAIALEVRQRREEAGISLSRLAREAGISKSHVHDIEAALTEPSWPTLARLASALGGQLKVRIEAGTGPPIRDHLQAAMIQATVRGLHRRWRRFLEVPVQRPVSGVIDLVLHDPDEPVIVASEAHSQLRRIEQQLRWSRVKSDALASGGAEELAAVFAQQADERPGTRTAVSRLLLLRSTRANRELVMTYRDLIATAYPARCADAHAALTATSLWPGPALVWLDVSGATASLRATPPRGVELGR